MEMNQVKISVVPPYTLIYVNESPYVMFGDRISSNNILVYFNHTWFSNFPNSVQLED